MLTQSKRSKINIFLCHSDNTLYNIYLYEVSTDDDDVKTPSLNFLLKNMKHSSLPMAEYMVCLDVGGNVIPLLVPSVVKKAKPAEPDNDKRNKSKNLYK